MMEDGAPPAAVVDNGSATIKAGLATDDLPRVVFPSVAGRQADKNWFDLSTTFVGEQAINLPNVLHPIDRGIVTNWDCLERSRPKKCSSCHCMCLVTLAPIEKKQQIAFETFNVPEFMYDATAHCAMYNAVTNLDVTGMVLQSGYEISHAYPLYEGNCLSHAIEGTAYGGADVTEALRKGIPQLRHERALPALMRQISSWKDQYAFCVSDGVLPPPFCDSVPPIESYSDKGLLSLLPNEMLLQIDRNIKNMQLSVTCSESLEFGKQITIPANARQECTELLFNSEPSSLVELFMNSLLKCDASIHQEIVSNVVVAGGNTCFPGFMERLKKEILDRLPSEDLKRSFQIIEQPTNERIFSAWKGGAKLANLPQDSITHGTPVKWLSKVEYDESGLIPVRRPW